MKSRARILLLGVITLSSTQCAHATPVTPAPAAPDEAPKLEAALIGTCQVTGTQASGGPVKEAKGIFWTFAPGGKFHQRVTAIGNHESDWSYHLDGRNVVTDGTFKTMRIDDYGGNTLKLFVYELSETYYCETQ